MPGLGECFKNTCGEKLWSTRCLVIGKLEHGVQLTVATLFSSWELGGGTLPRR